MDIVKEKVKEIVAENFAAEVLAQQGVVLVDFFAPWCAPCKMIAPLLNEVATEFDGLKVVKIDADNAESVMRQFGIRGVPTLLLFKNGEVVGSKVGGVPLVKMREFVLPTL